MRVLLITCRSLRGLAVVGLSGLLLSGCGSIGNTSAVRQANELAIACRTDEALGMAAQTADGQTLAGGIAELQRVVFLRDAGRIAEADRALEARNRRVDADAAARAETEQSVQKSLAELREERRARTGRAVCV
jgi:hypothetical protein